MKAVLVIDMPTSCLSCPFKLSRICDAGKWTFLKHESCPLRLLPDKWTPQIGGLNRLQQIANWNFAEGWNHCLAKIKGEETE